MRKRKFLSDIGYIKYGLDYLAPKQKLTFFLTYLLDNYEEKITKVLEIKVNYQDKTKHSTDRTFKINFSRFEGLILTRKPPLYIIDKNLEEIAKKILDPSREGRIEVVTYTKKEVEEEKHKK